MIENNDINNKISKSVLNKTKVAAFCIHEKCEKTNQEYLLWEMTDDQEYLFWELTVTKGNKFL